jgi:hypothetical protein
MLLIYRIYRYPDYKYKPRKRNDKGTNDSKNQDTLLNNKRRKYIKKQEGCRKRSKTAEENLRSYKDYGVLGLNPDPIKQIVMSELKVRINDLVSQGIVQIEEMDEEGSGNEIIEKTVATTDGNIIQANPSEPLLDPYVDQEHTDCEKVNDNTALIETEVAHMKLDNLEAHSNDNAVLIETEEAEMKVDNSEVHSNDIAVPIKTEVAHIKVDNLDDHSSDNAKARREEQPECSKQLSKPLSPGILPSSTLGIKEVYIPDISLDDGHFSFKSIEPVAESHLLLEDEALLIQYDSLDEASDELVVPLAAVTNAANALMETLEVVDSCVDYLENDGHDFPLIHSAAIGVDICYLEDNHSLAGNQVFADDTSSTAPSLSVTSNSSLSGDDDNEADLEDLQGSSSAYVPDPLSFCDSVANAKQSLESMTPADIFGTSPISVAALHLHESLSCLPYQLLIQKLNCLHQNNDEKGAEQEQQQEQEKEQEQEQEQSIVDWSLDDYIHVE